MRAHRSRKRQIEKYGYKFDNPDELARYEYLMLLYRAHEIGPIDVHPEFVIRIDGEKIGLYHADFAYVDTRTAIRIIEDCKPGYWAKKKQTRKGVVVREWKERALLPDTCWNFRKKVIEAACGIVITEIWK